MSHEPKFYNLPDHLARIFDSQEFHAAAKEVGKAVDVFRYDVTVALKALTEQARKEELQAFEKEVGDRALTHALEKFRDDLGESLKKIVARHRADETAAHEEKLTKRVLAATK